MDEQFDKKLNNRIRKVFDNFEDTSADKGWLLLREKFPKKKKDRGIIWLWLGSAAAILLLMLGIGTWVNLKKDEPAKLSYHVPKNNARATKPAHNEQSAVQQSISNQANSVQPVVVARSSNGPSSAQRHAILNQVHQTKTGIAAKTSVNTPIASTNSKPANNQASQNNTVVAPPVNNIHTENAVADNTVTKPVVANNTPVSAAALTKLNDTAGNKGNVAVVIPETITKPSIIKQQKADKTVKPDDGEKKVRFSVYAATYFSYASGSAGQLNAGAGITSDIKLTKNLVLSTGITIAQNSLNYSSQFPGQSIHTGYLPQINSFATASISGLYSAANFSIPVLKNYNAQLVSLDIPVDLKYKFSQSIFSSYVAVGLSSGTFINESYNSQYSNAGNNATSAQTNTNSFNNFYFAKMLNVAVGLGYPIGKNHLIIEPFLRYPLDGLGAQQIRFGSTGVNLKFGLAAPSVKRSYQ